jgi:hypothetical protein
MTKNVRSRALTLARQPIRAGSQNLLVELPRQRVARGVLEAVVAMHGRDTDEIEMPRRKQESDGIVVTWITVDQDFPLCH